MIWKNLTDSQHESIIRSYLAGEPVPRIAERYDLKVTSLERKIRQLKADGVIQRADHPFTISGVTLSRNYRTMIYSDVHSGQHDPVALAAVIEIARLFQPELVIANGDHLEGERVSRFRQTRSAPSSQYERDHHGEWTEELMDAAGEPELRLMTVGNHDYRYMAQSDDPDSFVSMDEYDIGRILYADELGFETPSDLICINPSGDRMYPDAQLYIHHGLFARKHAGASARAFSEKLAGASVVNGHNHKVAMAIHRTHRGYIKQYETGCLCTMEPSYDIFPNWTQAVLLGVLGPDMIDLHHVVIDRGKFVFAGGVVDVTD